MSHHLYKMFVCHWSTLVGNLCIWNDQHTPLNYFNILEEIKAATLKYKNIDSYSSEVDHFLILFLTSPSDLIDS